MKFHFVFKLLVLIAFYSCNNPDKKESPDAGNSTDTTSTDTTAKEKVFTYLKTDYPERVLAFKKMPDATVEQQVVKYERFSVLFIEYVSINKQQPLYSFVDRENNKEAYNVLRDEMVSLKEELKRNATSFSKDQENRLDAADANMNKFLPQVYK
jgi:hypothetical protein